MLKKSALLLALIVVSAGCTRSIETKYQPTFVATDAQRISATTIGLSRFVDKRSWVEQSDEKSRGFIGQGGSWKFGMTIDGKEFVPVANVVRDALSAELTRAGARTVSLDGTLGTTDTAKFDEVGKAAKVDYVLGGDITVFEFVNETGILTVTSRRAVSLTVKLKRVGDSAQISDKNYVENDRENEGLGVLHSTNVDRLLNRAMQKALHNIAADVAAALKLPASRVSVKIEYDNPA